MKTLKTQTSKDRARLQKLLRRIIPKQGSGRIAAAVSGGCDSVALLFLLHQYCRINQLKLCVFHVDHSLRENSNLDREWVAALAESLKLEFFSRKAEISDQSEIGKRGIEAWARDFRYRAFVDMAQESEASVVATGHTADDQLETMLMRIFSGSSLQGMAALRPESRLCFAGRTLQLWRPLLEIQRLELEDFLNNLNQNWREDETNHSDEFLRNSVRHRLVPIVTEIFPQAASKSALLLKDIDQLQSFISSQAQRYLDLNLQQNRLIVKNEVEIMIREIIRLWLIKLGFDRSITRSLIARVVDLWLNPAKNRAVDHRGFKFVRKKDCIEFFGENS